MENRTIEELEKELAVYAELADQSDKKTKEALNAVKSLTEERNSLTDENLQLQEQLVISNQVIGQLKVQLEEKNSKAGGGRETFERDGIKYEIRTAVYIPRMGKRTPLEIAIDEKAQDYLLAIKSGAIREIK